MVRSQFLRALLIALTLVTSVHPAQAQTTDPIASSVTGDPLYAPLIDSAEAGYLDSTESLTRYVVEADFTPSDGIALATIQGESSITYQNHTGERLREIYLRLYPNVAEYADGAMFVTNVEIDGSQADSELSQQDTLLTIELPRRLRDGGDIDVTLDFEVAVPTDPAQSYGMFKYDSDSNTYSLAHWMPLLAGWDSEFGWTTGPVSVNGDPVYTEAAVFDVTVTSPSELVWANSGSEIERDDVDAGTRQTRYATGPSRDFVMTASKDFEIQEIVSGETTVRSYAWNGYEDGSALVLQSAVQALETFNEFIGPYPYEELDLAQVRIGNGAGGVEFPGLVYIGAGFYDNVGNESGIPGFLEFIVAHEVGHQWFYNVIGNNQYQHAFMDEALVNYLTVVYFSAVYDAESANQQANLQLRLGYFDKLFQEGDEIVDQPTDDFDSMGDYGVIVYGKGALGFMELRREIGTDAFFAGLEAYYQDFAFKVAQPQDLIDAFETSSNNDLGEFWDHWFNQPNGTDDFDATDLARVLRELGQ